MLSRKFRYLEAIVPACLPSALGEAVNADGCTISDLCPCQHPAGDNWKNQGAYISCVAREAEQFVLDGLITEAEKDAAVAAAAHSDSGH